MERDRAFYKRQIATLQIGMESSGKKLRLLESQNDVMQTRRELLGDESIDEAVIQSNAEKIRRLKEKLDRDMDEKSIWKNGWSIWKGTGRIWRMTTREENGQLNG